MLAKDRFELNAVFPAKPCGRTPEAQSLIHRHSGIEANSAAADPILALVEGVYAVGEALQTQYAGYGAVITTQDITIRKAYPLGEPTRLQGRISSFEPNARGAAFTVVFGVMNGADDVLAEMASTMLLFDPSKPAHPTGELKVKGGPSAEPQAAATIGRFTFTPDAVRQFEHGYPPSPHSDLEMARAAGFPKPIVSGNQVFSIIWKRFVEPNYLLPVSLRFSLKRPIFWDEEITFEEQLAGASNKPVLEVRKTDGKTAIVCEISGQAITN